MPISLRIGLLSNNTISPQMIITLVISAKRSTITDGFCRNGLLVELTGDYACAEVAQCQRHEPYAHHLSYQALQGKLGHSAEAYGIQTYFTKSAAGMLSPAR